MVFVHRFVLSLLLLALGRCVLADESQSIQSKESQVSHKSLLNRLVGKWEGTCRTWFEPGKLVDESKVQGEITEVMDGRFIRHTYVGSMKGKKRIGEELIALNAVTKQFQITWIDDFHMNYAILFSVGPGSEDGFSVHGEYDVGENQPRWGWRTEFKLPDDDHLIITAFNVEPSGEESKAVETTYERVAAPQ